jgi:carbon monoxide dehydrogenase subunit G
MIKAVINVDAPASHVFNILTDFPRYKEWIPGCEQCVVTAQDGTTTDANIVVNGMKRIELGLRFIAEPPQVLSFKMLKGKDIKSYSGTYRLMDAVDGKGTVVIAELEIDAGFMVPKFMVDKISRKMIDDTGAALRSRVSTVQFTGASSGSPIKQPAVHAKPRRAKRILRVNKVPSGYSVWLLGESFTVKSRDS